MDLLLAMRGSGRLNSFLFSIIGQSFQPGPTSFRSHGDREAINRERDLTESPPSEDLSLGRDSLFTVDFFISG